MTEKKPKRPRDPALLAKLMVDIATGEVDDHKPAIADQGKNQFAVELGRRGGLRGGKARAESLSKERRAEISRHAAIKRWAAKASKD